MRFLSKLSECFHYAGAPGLSENVACAPAELPRIEVNLRDQSFQRPEASASTFARMLALGREKPDAAASIPAPMPDIDLAIPKLIPDPPPLAIPKPPSKSSV